MSRISLAPHADPETAFAVVRRIFTGRDHRWEPCGPHEAVAHEGGEPITAPAVSHKLRAGVRLD